MTNNIASMIINGLLVDMSVLDYNCKYSHPDKMDISNFFYLSDTMKYQ